MSVDVCLTQKQVPLIFADHHILSFEPYDIEVPFRQDILNNVL